jgi:lysyl-tRNA synthetase class 2
VETPLLVESPGTEVHVDGVAVTLHDGTLGASQPRFLITSPEYHMKRLLSAGAGPIFQVARVFRDGERGVHHRPEFTMLEWYRPFSDYESLMKDCERLLRHLLDGVSLSYQGVEIDLGAQWPRITFRDALRELGGVDPDSLSPDDQLQIMVDSVEKRLDPTRPVFITEFPRALASLARPKPGNDGVAERFELFIGGLELANAFSELTDPMEQRRRCLSEIEERRALGKPHQPTDEAFLGALEEGMPPSSGIALGFDRLVMLLTDSRTIDDVLAF